MTFVCFSCVVGKHAASYIRVWRWGRRAVQQLPQVAHEVWVSKERRRGWAKLGLASFVSFKIMKTTDSLKYAR